MTVKIGKIEDFFLSSYTGQGYFSFLKDRLEEAKEVYFIKGGSFRVRSRFLRNLAMNFADRGYYAQRVHSPFNLKNLEGLIIPQLGILFIGEEWNQSLNLDCFVCKKNILDFTCVLNSEKIGETKEKIIKLTERINIHKEIIRENLKKVEELEEKIEDLYQESVDFDKVNELEEQLIAEILKK